MSSENPVWALIATFGLMSLFAVGGAAAAVPEMHRIAVDVHHRMTDKQFADAYAIAQLSPGPNRHADRLRRCRHSRRAGGDSGDVPVDGAACPIMSAGF